MCIRLIFALIGASGFLGAPFVECLHAQPKQENDASAKNVRLVVDYGGPDGLISSFSSDNREFINVSLSPLTIRTFDAATGDCLRVVRMNGVPTQQRTVSVNGIAVVQQDLVLSPNLKTFAFCSNHGVYLINTRDGQIENILSGHGAPVTRAAFSADSKYLATFSADNTARIWNLATARTEKTFKIGEGASGALFSPDGTQLAIGYSGPVSDPFRKVPAATEIFDTATTTLLLRLEKMRIVAWGPRPDTFVVAHDLGNVFKAPNIKLVSKTGAVIFDTAEAQLLVSADRTRYVCGKGVFDLSTGKNIATYPLPGVLRALSPNGQLVAAWARLDERLDSVKISSTADGKLVSTLAPAGLPSPVTRPAWSRDGKSIAWDEGGKSLNLFELSFGPPLDKNDRHENVLEQDNIELEWSKGKVDISSKLTLTRHEKPVAFVLKTPKEQAEIGCRVEPCFLSKGEFEARFAVASTFELQLFTLARNDKVAHLAGTALAGHMLANKFLTASPEGRYLMLASGSKIAIVNPEAIWTGPKRHGFPNQNEPLLWIEMIGNDWIIWNPEGYYAASPGAEKLVGWVTTTRQTKEELSADGQTKKTYYVAMNYYPLEAFRKQMYRPDVIGLLLAKGSLNDALATANDILKKQNKSVAEGVADVERLLPPTVRLQVLDKKDLPKIKVKASALAMVAGQPVTSLRLLVDGRPLQGGACLQTFGAGQKEAEAEWQITLPPGKHQLTVLGRCPDSSSRSNTVEVAVADPAKQHALHVLAIGINDYEDDALKLGFAVKDAQDIAANFTKCCKGDLFHEVHSEALVNGKARKDAILSRLSALRKLAKPNDLVVIFFAGHGVKDKDKFYLLPAEAKTADLAKTAISGEELRKSLGEFPCQVLLILDACHSSASLKDFRPAVDDIARTLTDDDCGVAVLCSALAHEKSLDRAGNGLFTRAIVDGLNRRGGVAYNTFDRTLYVHHLHACVLDRVSQQSGGRQHPFLSLPWVVESFPVAKFATK